MATLIIFAAFFSSFVWAEQADFHHYSWARIPLTAEQCQTKSGEIAHAVAETSVFKELGAKLWHSEGIVETQGCRITITFLSTKEPPPLVATDLTRSALIADIDLDYDFWGYKNAQECNADLPHQVDLFRSQTGLEPLISYCYEYKYSSNQKTAYQPRVQALGNAKRQMRTFPVPDVSETGHTKVLNDLIQYLEANSGKVSRVNIKSGHEFFLDEEVIHYYGSPVSARRLQWFTVYRPLARKALKFLTQEECQGFTPELAAFLKGAKGTPVTSDCSVDQDGSRLNVAYESIANITTFRDQWKFQPDVRYTALSQCLTDRAKTVAFFKNNINQYFNVAFCTLEWDPGTNKQFYMMYVGY
ncbi:MAG: hypothetical protein HYR96_10830 [Deltaproteobacteria bacterium]|nr:hypothetical protein [Deltaproteobacteria bacterium]MBI3293616.1 hypothetical protein [Deltaproteobacteria bacterium]